MEAAGCAARTRVTERLPLEPHGGWLLLDSVCLWSNVPRIIKTFRSKGNLEDIGSPESAVVLLARHAWQILDGGVAIPAWTSRLKHLYHL